VAEDEFVRDVRQGLTDPIQKRLAPKYFYDDVGSALFEAITRLPEYGLARADERIIDRHAAFIVGSLEPGVVVAELGSGSGTKTRRILSELGLRGETRYFPIDISMGALERCQAELGAIGRIRVSPIPDTYLDGLNEASRRAPAGAQILLLFLGSTIGNFDRQRGRQFLGDLRARMKPRDYLLLGTDLEKPVDRLLAAYDDPAGVTAAFNKNLLARINRELDGDFDLACFDHAAHYDESHRRIEIHLRATRDQTVRIGAANLTVELRRRETIWTESSHKFNCEEVVEMGQATGFRCAAQWVDADWPFAETLLVAE
jgi:dimethylhistidine N-methyltransferase